MNTRILSRSGGLGYRRAALAAGALIVALGAVVNFSTAVGQQPGFSQQPGFGNSFADVVEQVSPSVVNISVSKTVRSMPTRGVPRSGSPMDEFFGRFFDLPQGVPNQERRRAGEGSGFIVGRDGYIATNQHVIDGADEVTVTFESGEQLEAEVVGQDPLTDIAVIKVDANDLPVLEFGDSDRARVGDWVLAIGNPFGLGGTATAGIISARGRDIQSGRYDDYLQIDAPINAGNSGGPVFNSAGEVIGINTAIFSPTGGNVGIGFAIPSNQAQRIIQELTVDGSVERGWLGVQIQSLDDDIAASLGLDDDRGALIAEVVAGSPADRAGLRVGDVVVTLDGEAVESARTLGQLVGNKDAGQRVDVEIWRDGRLREVEVTLGDLASTETFAAAGSQAEPDATLGLGLTDLGQAERERLGLSPEVSGALVVSVEPGSPASEQGIRPGDVIVQVNQANVTSARAAREALAMNAERNGGALVLLRRGDSQRFVALGAA